MLALVSGEVVKVDLKPARVNAETGEVTQYWDAFIRSDDPVAAADRITGKVSETTPCPGMGDWVVATVSITARSGNYGAYLSAMARAVAVETAAERAAA
jgi:hypothetical protein